MTSFLAGITVLGAVLVAGGAPRVYAEDPAPRLVAAEYDPNGTLSLDIVNAGALAPQVFVDGQPVATGGEPPVVLRSQGSVVLAIEASSSTAGALLAREQAMARELIEALPPDIAVGIVAFGDSARTVAPISTDRAATLAALTAISTGSGSALYDGVQAAAALASTGAEPRSLVVMTFGWHFGSNAVTRSASADAARASGATVHAFAFGSDFDGPYLRGIAGASGTFTSNLRADAATAVAPRIGSTVSRMQLRLTVGAGSHTVSIGSGPAASSLEFTAAGAARPGPTSVRPGATAAAPQDPAAPLPVEDDGGASAAWTSILTIAGLAGAVGAAYLVLRAPARLRSARLAARPARPERDPDATPPEPPTPRGPDGGNHTPRPSLLSTTAAAVRQSVAPPPPLGGPATAEASAARVGVGGWLRALRSRMPSPQVPSMPAGLPGGARMTSEPRIARGLKRMNLGVRYQPVFRTETGELVGAEALLRAESDAAASMTARAVVRMATAQGQMPEITELVVGDACRVAALMTAAGASEFQVSVNISVEQLLERAFISAVRTALGESKLTAGRLALEVPEHGLLENSRALALLQEAATLGVHTIVDDFWASDPAVFGQLPAGTAVKVDVSRAGGSERAERELRRIVDTARAAGLAVTAKRVESKEDRAFAQTLGCEFAQGNQFSEPVTGAELLTVAAPLAELNRIAESLGGPSENGDDGGPARRVA